MGDREHCRICHKSNGKLFQPCKCRGTISSVHASCIKEWIVKTSSLRCSVCRCPFVVTRVYDNASRAEAASPKEDELTSTSGALRVVVAHYARVSFELAGRGAFFVVVWLLWAPFFLSFTWALLFHFDDVWNAVEGVLVSRPPRTELASSPSGSSGYDFFSPTTVYVPGLVLTVVGWGLLVLLATWWAYCQENGRNLEDPLLALPGLDQGNAESGAGLRDWAKEVMLEGSDSSSGRSSDDTGSEDGGHDSEVPTNDSAPGGSGVEALVVDRLRGSGPGSSSKAEEGTEETETLVLPPSCGNARRNAAAPRRPSIVDVADIVGEGELPSMIHTLSRRERLRHAVGLHDNTINALEHFGLQGSLHDATILAVTFIVVFVPVSIMVLAVIPLWVGRQLGAGVLFLVDAAVAWDLLPPWMTASCFVAAFAVTGRPVSLVFPLSLAGPKHLDPSIGPFQGSDSSSDGRLALQSTAAASSGDTSFLGDLPPPDSEEGGAYVACAFVAWAMGLIVVSSVLRIVARLTRPDEVRRCFAYTSALLRVVVATITHMIALPVVYALVIAVVCSDFLVSSSLAQRAAESANHVEGPRNVFAADEIARCSRQLCEVARQQLPPLTIVVQSHGHRQGSGAQPTVAVAEDSSRRLLSASSPLDLIQSWRQRERCATCWVQTPRNNASLSSRDGRGGGGRSREAACLFVLEGYEPESLSSSSSSAASALELLKSLREYEADGAAHDQPSLYSSSWRSFHALLHALVHLCVFSDLYTWLPLYLTGLAVSTVQWTCWYHVRRLCHPAMFSWIFRNAVDTPLMVQFVSLSGPLVLLHALRNVALTCVSAVMVLRPALVLLSSVFPGATPVLFSWSSGNPVVDGLSANLLIFGGRMVRFIAIVGGQPLEEEVLFRRFAMLADFLRDVHEAMFDKVGRNLSLLPFLRSGLAPRPQSDFFFPLRLALLAVVYVCVAIGRVFCAFLPGVAVSVVFSWNLSGGVSSADGDTPAPPHDVRFLSYLLSMITSPEAAMLVRSVSEERQLAEATDFYSNSAVPYHRTRHGSGFSSPGMQQHQYPYPTVTVHSLIIGWSLVLVAYQLYDALLPYLTQALESVRRVSPSLTSLRFVYVEQFVASSTVGTLRLRRLTPSVVGDAAAVPSPPPLPSQLRPAVLWELQFGRFQNPRRLDPSAQESPAEWLLAERELVHRLSEALRYVQCRVAGAGDAAADSAVSERAAAVVESVLRDACAHILRHRPLGSGAPGVESLAPGVPDSLAGLSVQRSVSLSAVEGILLQQALAHGSCASSIDVALSATSYLLVLAAGFGLLPILVGNGLQRLFTTGTIRASTQELLLSLDTPFYLVDVRRLAASWCLGALMLVTLWGAWKRTLPRLTRRLMDFWRYGMLHANVFARPGASHVLRVLACALWLTAGLACLPHSTSRGLRAATSWYRSHTPCLLQQPDAAGELEMLMLHFGLVEWVVTALWMVLTSVLGDRIPLLAVPSTSSWVDEARQGAAARQVEAEALAATGDAATETAAAHKPSDAMATQHGGNAAADPAAVAHDGDRPVGERRGLNRGARPPDRNDDDEDDDALLRQVLHAVPGALRMAVGDARRPNSERRAADDGEDQSLLEKLRRRLVLLARAILRQNRDDVHLVDFKVHPSQTFEARVRGIVEDEEVVDPREQ